jgi:membrane protein
MIRFARDASADEFGPLAGQSPLWEIPSILVPALVTFASFAALYRWVPASHPRWRDVLPGAIFAGVLFEVLKNSFAIYIANFNNYDVIFGSLAGIAIFLFYVYLSAIILLIGAEVARTSERLHAGEFEAEIHPVEPGEPIAEQALRAVKGLFLRQ